MIHVEDIILFFSKHLYKEYYDNRYLNFKLDLMLIVLLLRGDGNNGMKILIETQKQ